MTNTPPAIETANTYSKLRNFWYFMRKWGILPYFPLLAASWLAANAPYNYTEAYQKWVAWIIDHKITQQNWQVIRLTEEEWIDLDLNSYIQDWTEIRTTTYETPEWNWVQNLRTGIDETWRTRKFGIESVEKILEDSGNNNTFWRAENFELQPENLPSEDEIQDLIVTLKELIDSWNIIWSIDIEWFSSPEWSSPEDLTTNSWNSFDKNESLAIARASYIQDRLLQEIPEITQYLWEITAVVNTLREDDIETLFNAFNFSSLDDIHDLLRDMNRWEITLSTKQSEVISGIFMRGVTLDYSIVLESQEKNNIDYSIEYTNKPFNEGLMALFVLVWLLMSWSILNINAHRKIQSAYMKNPDSRRWKRASEFLGTDEINRINNFKVEMKKHK